MSGDLANSKMLTSELCFTLFRLFSAIAGIVATLLFKTIYVNPVLHDIHIPNGFQIYHSRILPLSAVVILNDIFVLTVDYQRTNTYLGLLFVQATFSFVVSVLVGVVMSRVVSIQSDRLFLIYFGTNGLPEYTPIILSGACSLCLLVLDLLALWSIRSDLSPRNMWLVNAKDTMVGRIPIGGPHKCTWKGHTRSPPRSRVYGVTVSTFPKRFVMGLLFRRVSPAETRPYALVRNVFSILSISIIVWRTVTALSHAQNEIETRIISSECPQPRYAHSIYMLLNLRTYPGETWDSSNITMSSKGFGFGEKPCNTPDLLQEAALSLLPSYKNLSRAVFNCPVDTYDTGPTTFDVWLHWPYPVDPAPNVWLSNQNVSFESPPLQLRPGFHIDADASIINRRFISSSVFRDVILQGEPKYREVLMYPIRAIKITSLNNSKTATASITTSFQPRQWTSETIAGPKRLDDFCDCIEDYRSTTVFEVIGSVGGLFALLQSLHILLFGRPMLWGLTGAKLVTPFGLLGGCSSAGFKRRLRSEYHLQDSGSGRHPEDIAETIRIGAFLRDFVIDFGPADVPPVPVASSQTVAESEPLRTDQPPVSERSEILLLPMPHVGRLSLEDLSK